MVDLNLESCRRARSAVQTNWQGLPGAFARKKIRMICACVRAQRLQESVQHLSMSISKNRVLHSLACVKILRNNLLQVPCRL